VSAPVRRPSRRVTSAGNATISAAAGVWGIIKVAFAIVSLLVIGLGIWGYQRAHSPEFKQECAAYQAHMISMGFPDNALCLMFWNLS
jgi:hypothetical protein